MAADNLDALKRLYRGWAAGDVGAGLALMDPHVVYISQPTDPDRGPHYGLEASNEYMRRFLESWDNWRIEATEYREVAGSFVVKVHRTATGKGSGVPIEDQAVHVWTFRGSSVIRLEIFEREADALESVGISDRLGMPEDAARGILVAAGEGPVVPNPAAGPLVFKMRGHETGGALTVFESVAAPGEGPPLHTHRDDDELIYFLEGRFRAKLGDEIQEAPAGSVIFIPKRSPHTWQNVGDAPGRFLVVFAPAAPRMEAFFERAATSAGEDIAAVFERLGRDAGMEVVGPPLAQSDPLP